ncbi:phage/plasmid primase P4 [Ktedonobacteria bacterium brp13]|nr:phage/plasmid primase P4 [Ktedonobacteria bacterium brp13]
MKNFAYGSSDNTSDFANNKLRYIRDLELNEQQIKLLEFEPDNDGNARAVAFLYGDFIRYTDQQSWIIWNGKYWETNRHAVKHLVIDTLRKRKTVAALANDDRLLKKCSADASNINAVMSLLESYVATEITEFDKEIDFLPVPNGLINLQTGELLPHNPDKGFTFVANVEYDPNADYREWEQFLLSSVGGVKILKMWCGYMLTGHTREEKMLYIYGPTRSGKGTFTETLHSLLPDPIAQEKSINTFVAKNDENTNNFDLASLKPALMVFASESARYQSLNAAKVKVMTGGNQLVAAYKGKDEFRFKPKFKICLTSNFEVDADVDDDAIWGRLIAVEFPNSHLDKEDISLKERLRTYEAKQGVLRWAVEGAIEWYKQGRLIVPECLKKNVQERRKELDTISQWIEDCAIIDGEGQAASGDVIRSYGHWCEENAVEPKKGKHFSQAIKKRYPQVELRPKMPGTQTRGYVGLRLVSTNRSSTNSF